MSNNLHFAVYGKPVGKARARTVRKKDGGSFSYTPENTADWENSILNQILSCRQQPLWDGPIRVHMTFRMPKPKSAKKKEKWCAKKPDLDNLEKSIMDTMEGVIYTNDSRIVEKHTYKPYVKKDESPCVEVSIEELLEEGA